MKSFVNKYKLLVKLTLISQAIINVSSSIFIVCPILNPTINLVNIYYTLIHEIKPIVLTKVENNMLKSLFFYICIKSKFSKVHIKKYVCAFLAHSFQVEDTRKSANLSQCVNRVSVHVGPPPRSIAEDHLQISNRPE